MTFWNSTILIRQLWLQPQCINVAWKHQPQANSDIMLFPPNSISDQFYNFTVGWLLDPNQNSSSTSWSYTHISISSKRRTVYITIHLTPIFSFFLCRPNAALSTAPAFWVEKKWRNASTVRKYFALSSKEKSKSFQKLTRNITLSFIEGNFMYLKDPWRQHKT